jgi:hypothetical protein
MDKSSITQIINQLFDIQNKLNEMGISQNFERNIKRLQSVWEENGYIIQNPTNEMYSDARTDCEANIVGTASNKMVITKTLKPIIYQKQNETIQLLQKAVVMVEKK